MAGAPVEFDPYAEWLRVPPGPRPPDHYALLGLQRFAGTSEEIEDRAHKQLERLDRYALSPDAGRRTLCQTLMNQVAQARVTLTDEKKRQLYDAELRGASPPTRKPVA